MQEPTQRRCNTSEDCAPEEQCVAERCQPRTTENANEPVLPRDTNQQGERSVEIAPTDQRETPPEPSQTEPGLGFFYIMEHLHGRPLSDYVQSRHSFSQRIVLHLFGPLCRGMAAAHRAGIVHRDLKPANLFLVRRQHEPYFLKIIDFGIAKPLEMFALRANLCSGPRRGPSFLRAVVYGRGSYIDGLAFGNSTARGEGGSRSEPGGVWTQQQSCAISYHL